MKLHRLTWFPLFLVAGTLGLTSASNKQTPRDNIKDSDYVKQLQAGKLRFPTAEYDEGDLTDPKRNERLKQKKTRKNDFKLVARNPPAWQTERVAINEGGLDFPALPVAQSEYIILGKSVELKLIYLRTKRMSIQSSRRKGSEDGEQFNFPGNRNHGGQDRWIRKVPERTKCSLPDRRYEYAARRRDICLCLTSKNYQDISTAYKPGATVTRLDESPQFEKYRGLTETTLLQNVPEL